jgi:hypothetical protein
LLAKPWRQSTAETRRILDRGGKLRQVWKLVPTCKQKQRQQHFAAILTVKYWQPLQKSMWSHRNTRGMALNRRAERCRGAANIWQ